MAASGPGAHFRVLYVDDNRDTADSAVLLLSIIGFEARACYDGQTALQIAATFRPAVCMLDLHMPGMDGDEVARRMRAEPWCPLLLVAVTAMSDEGSCKRLTEAGFDLHFVKPIDPQNLIAVVNLLCQSASSANAVSAISKEEST